MNRRAPLVRTRMADNAMAKSTLHRRIWTALWLAALVLGAVWLLPTAALALFLGAFVLIAAWEWCGLAGIHAPLVRGGYLLLMAAVLLGLWRYAAQLWPLLLVMSLLWWLLQSWRLWRIQAIPINPTPQPQLLLVGLLILSATWTAVLSVHQLTPHGPGLVLALLLLIATADSAAYFSGRRWGRTKLAPHLSPGKTWAGVYGALTGAALVSASIAFWLDLSPLHSVAMLVLGVLVAMLSIVGDLYESLLKRRRHLKDSSQLLPGHGGLLDRIDSLTAAAPLYALGLTWAVTGFPLE